MNNPCKICLLVNNCTAICEDKENLQTLLKQAIRTYRLGITHSNRPTTDYVRRYNFWQKLDKENDREMEQITFRAYQLKQDNI